jgi:drug/metabolite transporter (DMT)-like permease
VSNGLDRGIGTPLAAGLLLFRERLGALQVFGICVAVAGLTLVSMSTRLA